MIRIPFLPIHLPAIHPPPLIRRHSLLKLQHLSPVPLESVKTAAEVYTPVSGEVVETNTAMPDDLDLITKPVTEGGWIAKIKITDTSELEGLMDEAAYTEFLKTVD